MKYAYEHRGLALILLVFIIIGCCHALWTPLFVKPDEEWHFAYVVHVRQTGSLPSARERTAYEGYQPPLYYLLGVLVSLPIRLDDAHQLYYRNPHFLSTVNGNHNLFAPCPSQAAKAVYLLRFLSLAFGVTAVIATYLMGLRLCSKEIALMGSAGLALLPTFAFITTSVTNDAAVISFTALVLVVATDAIKNGLNARKGAIFGLFAGLATLSKLIGLFSFALLPVLALRSPGSGKEKRKGIMAALGGLLLPLPWFVRNYLLFGDPLALFGLSPKPAVNPGDLYEMIVFAWKSFWLDFSPGRLLYGPLWMYWAYGAIVFVGLFGLLRGLRTLARVSHEMNPTPLGQEALPFPTFVTILCLYGLVVTSIFASLLVISIKHFTGGGRYLLPAAGAVMLLLAWGFKNLFSNRWLPFLWYILWGLSAFYALFGVLIPGYYPQSTKSAVSADPIGLLKDEIALVEYQYDKRSLGPGDDLKVMITWQLLKPTSERYSVFVQLLTPGEQVVAQVDTYPGLGYYPTCRWKVGRAVRDFYILRLPETLPVYQGPLRLIAGMYKFETMERLAAYQVERGEKKRLYQDAFTLGFLQIRGQGEP